MKYFGKKLVLTGLFSLVLVGFLGSCTTDSLIGPEHSASGGTTTGDGTNSYGGGTTTGDGTNAYGGGTTTGDGTNAYGSGTTTGDGTNQ